MPAASYCALELGARYLAGIPADNGFITAPMLLEAEAKARTTINTWLLAICGETTGKTIIAALTAATETNVDPDIKDLADLHASGIVREWYEIRNAPQGEDSEAAKDSPAAKIKDSAVAKAKSIAMAGKVMKVDGTVRRLRYAAREQGPAAGGPMAGGSYFDPRGYTYDYERNFRWVPRGYDPLADAGL